MEYYKNRICVTVEDLIRSDDGEAVMTLPIYRGYYNRNYFRMMRRGGGLGCYALIEFESLPPRYKARFIDKYSRPEEVLKGKPITEELAIDGKARGFYRDHLLPDGSRMTDEQIDEYTVNASVLNQLIRLINDRRSKRRAHGGQAADFWEAILTTSENFREYPGHTLPKGKSQLQNKINDYKKSGYSALISGKLGNANSIKITEEVGDQIVALKRSKVPVYNNAQIFDEINRLAIERGWKPLRSEKSLVQFLHRPEVEPRWWDAVHGEQDAHQRYSRKHKTEMARQRDAIWYSDGTKLNLYYKAFDGGKLVVRTTQVYEVMDAYSETFLGFHISDRENFDAQYHAFRMAIETYRHRPYEIVNDNQGGHKKGANNGFFERITGRIARNTAPYGPTGKSIESAFGRFQSQVLHRDWRFTGPNITAKGSDNLAANLEFLEANKEHMFTLEELKETYAKARQEWNMALHPIAAKPRLSMYLSSQNAEAKNVSDLDLMELFWLQTDKPVTFTPNGITITVNKEKYTFEVFDKEGLPDLGFRRDNTYRKFVVMYDPLDMTHVRLFSQDKNGGLRYVTDAHPYACFARAIQEQQPGDMEFIRTMSRMTEQERIRRQMEAAELETAHGVAPEQHGLNRPKIKGVSAKTVERVMTELSKAAAPEPYEEIVDIGLAHKFLSNQTPLEMGSRYDKM
ncbi:MAG: kinase [Alistipes sp.]|jgi:hypothetical protein|nr:kinase [Alistipes sp.]